MVTVDRHVTVDTQGTVDIQGTVDRQVTFDRLVTVEICWRDMCLPTYTFFTICRQVTMNRQ